MNQKAIKIKINIGNGATVKPTQLDSSHSPKDEYVILGPNYPGIAAILLVGILIFGGGWWYLADDEPVSEQILISDPQPKVSPLVGPLTEIPSDLNTTNRTLSLAVEKKTDAQLETQPLVQEKATSNLTAVFEPEAEPEQIPKTTTKPETQTVVDMSSVTPQPIVSVPKPITSQHVPRAQFTRGVYQREPVDVVEQLSLTGLDQASVKLFFFSELKGLQGKTVIHRWLYEDAEVAKIKFQVRGNRWRVYSSKNIQAGKQGAWRVIVNDEQGNILHSSELMTVE